MPKYPKTLLGCIVGSTCVHCCLNIQDSFLSFPWPTRPSPLVLGATATGPGAEAFAQTNPPGRQRVRPKDGAGLKCSLLCIMKATI